MRDDIFVASRCPANWEQFAILKRDAFLGHGPRRNCRDKLLARSKVKINEALISSL